MLIERLRAKSGLGLGTRLRANFREREGSRVHGAGRQRDGSVHHHFLTKGRWNHVVTIPEWRKHDLRQALTQRLEKQLLTQERNAAADNDATRTQERDRLPDGDRERV